MLGQRGKLYALILIIYSNLYSFVKVLLGCVLASTVMVPFRENLYVVKIVLALTLFFF